MEFKIVVYTQTQVLYFIIPEEELDSIYIKYSNSQIFILNIIQN